MSTEQSFFRKDQEYSIAPWFLFNINFKTFKPKCNAFQIVTLIQCCLMIVCLLICYGNLLVNVLSSQCCQHKTNKRDSVIRKTGTAEENSSVTVFGFIHRTKMYSMILTFLVVLVCKVCRCYCMSCHSENSDATCS